MLERQPANGVYVGRLRVRVIAPGISGEDRELGLSRRFLAHQSRAARSPHRVNAYALKRCGICGERGHDRRTCGRVA